MTHGVVPLLIDPCKCTITASALTPRRGVVNVTTGDTVKGQPYGFLPSRVTFRERVSKIYRIGVCRCQYRSVKMVSYCRLDVRYE